MENHKVSYILHVLWGQKQGVIGSFSGLGFQKSDSKRENAKHDFKIYIYEVWHNSFAKIKVTSLFRRDPSFKDFQRNLGMTNILQNYPLDQIHKPQVLLTLFSQRLTGTFLKFKNVESSQFLNPPPLPDSSTCL